MMEDSATCRIPSLNEIEWFFVRANQAKPDENNKVCLIIGWKRAAVLLHDWLTDLAKEGMPIPDAILKAFEKEEGRG